MIKLSERGHPSRSAQCAPSFIVFVDGKCISRSNKGNNLLRLSWRTCRGSMAWQECGSLWNWQVCSAEIVLIYYGPALVSNPVSLLCRPFATTELPFRGLRTVAVSPAQIFAQIFISFNFPHCLAVTTPSPLQYPDISLTSILSWPSLCVLIDNDKLQVDKQLP